MGLRRRLRELFCAHEHSTWDEVTVKDSAGVLHRVKVFRCSGCGLVRERDTRDIRPSKAEWDKRFVLASEDASWMRWCARIVRFQTGPETPSANIVKEKVKS